MKIALVGGGGARTPAVLYAFAKHAAVLGVDEIALFDTSRERVQMMQIISRRLLEGMDVGFRVVVESRPEAAIDRAEFVIVSIRVGGQEARAADERIALEHGCIGQETTGPGGFSYALRSIPVVLYYAEMVGQVAPNAVLINFTNPSGLISQALIELSPVPILGVCDSPQVIAQQISRAAGVAEEELDWRYSGLNHLGWVTSARHRGRELLPELLEDDLALDRLVAGDLIPGDLIRHLGVVPNEYCYYYYYRQEALARQLAAGETRGQVLARLERQLQEDVTHLDQSDVDGIVEAYGRYYRAREESYLATERQAPRSLGRETLRELILKGGEGYIGVALKIIAGLGGHGTHRAVLNMPNSGVIIPGMDDDDVLEMMCEITADGIMPLPGPPLAHESLGLLRMVKAYECLAVETALSGSRRLAIRALTHHPLVASYPLAEKLVDAYLIQHRHYLPRFWQDGP